ncbi:MAG: diacylglycerol kinase [Pirellulaceae bacterium]|jgi:diacylglycerol kinase|nr:diacylglycerol kinase [Pirellulaceae bacterium]
MVERYGGHTRTWRRKFAAAGRGGVVAARDHASFWVHGGCTAAVLAAGVALHLETWQWCTVLLCITIVLVAEMLNTALEALAPAVDPEFNPHLRDALDIAAAAVLTAAAGAVTIGLIVFLTAL